MVPVTRHLNFWSEITTSRRENQAQVVRRRKIKKKKKKNSAKYEGWHRSDARELAKSPYVFLYDFRWSCTHQKTQGYERRCPGMSSCRSPCQGAVHRTDFPLKATWSFLMSLASLEKSNGSEQLSAEKNPELCSYDGWGSATGHFRSSPTGGK